MKKPHAFTLIELLVVIAIIGFLSVITFAVLNSSREKARAARIISDFKNIETAMHLYMDNNNYGIWPREGGSFNVCIPPATCACPTPPPNCNKMTNDNFADLVTLGYLPVNPDPDLTGTVDYRYDNDGDAYPNDGTLEHAGVNITIRPLDVTTNEYATYLDLLDEMIDDSDGPLIGKIRGNRDEIIFYLLSSHELIY